MITFLYVSLINDYYHFILFEKKIQLTKDINTNIFIVRNPVNIVYSPLIFQGVRYNRSHSSPIAIAIVFAEGSTAHVDWQSNRTRVPFARNERLLDYLLILDRLYGLINASLNSCTAISIYKNKLGDSEITFFLF